MYLCTQGLIIFVPAKRKNNTYPCLIIAVVDFDSLHQRVNAGADTPDSCRMQWTVSQADDNTNQGQVNGNGNSQCGQGKHSNQGNLPASGKPHGRQQRQRQNKDVDVKHDGQCRLKLPPTNWDQRASIEDIFPALSNMWNLVVGGDGYADSMDEEVEDLADPDGDFDRPLESEQLQEEQEDGGFGKEETQLEEKR